MRPTTVVSPPALLQAVALEWRHEGGEGARAGEHELFLAASAARDADLAPALLLLPTFGARPDLGLTSARPRLYLG